MDTVFTISPTSSHIQNAPYCDLCNSDYNTKIISYNMAKLCSQENNTRTKIYLEIKKCKNILC
jgi:hypothetical protein